jgi:hypothetical protein
MGDVVLGVAAIAAGALFCFRGYLALRAAIPVLGALAGFALGAGVVASASGDEYLGTALGWLVGLCGAFLLALIAYLYYQAAVLIASASIGFTLGASLMVALDVSWSWAVILVAVLVGILFAAAALVVDLPSFLLVLVSALGGAAVMSAGLMLLTGALDRTDFSKSGFVGRVEDDWWWYAIWVFLASVGVVAQRQEADALSMSARRRRPQGA